jgi:Protein of unknown function (DUF2924)
MENAAIDLAETLARLSAAAIFELRGEWRRLHRAPPPMRLSRDLLMRGIAYKLQERPLGSLSKSLLRKLECQNNGLEASNTKKPVSPISLKAGTRLIREWRGVTHTVLARREDTNGTAGNMGPSRSSPMRSPGPIGRVRVSSVCESARALPPKEWRAKMRKPDRPKAGQMQTR